MPTKSTIPDTFSWHPDYVTDLGTLMFELSFLGSVSKFTFKEPARQMADFISLARSHTYNFCIFEHFGLPVVVRL